MKKQISVLRIVALLLSTLTMLTSCFHECAFVDAWTTDADNHWHVCKGKNCDEITAPEAHTWDDGKITTKATQEAEGVKTYTCTVCAITKTETVKFTGLSKADWNAVISEEVFNNYTIEMITKATALGASSGTTLLYKVGDEKMYARMNGSGQTQEQTFDDAAEVAEGKKELAKSFMNCCYYDSYTYDAEDKVYYANKNIVTIDGSVTDDVTVRFENGKLAEIKYNCIQIQSGISVSVFVTITFSDYGTTVVE